MRITLKIFAGANCGNVETSIEQQRLEFKGRNDELCSPGKKYYRLP